jgi:hypothetical protein
MSAAVVFPWKNQPATAAPAAPAQNQSLQVNGAAAHEPRMIDRALSYIVTRRWSVFPAPPGHKMSYVSGKDTNGNRWGATKNVEEAKEYFEEYLRANIGLPTGQESGFFVTEADTLKAHNKDGIASLHKLQAEHGPLPATLMAESPSGSQQQLRVWYWNGEDPKEELDRRFAAACKHYNLTKEDIGDHLFVDSGRAMPIVIAEDTRSGTRIAVPVIKEIIATLIENRIDVLIIDPFVSCHRVAENDNAAIERVAKSWSNISEVADCSISLAHHVRKTGGESVTVEDGRGASALRDAVRKARTLNNMTAREAENAEIEERDRQLYFRCDIGKRNLTRPAEKVDWFKLESVDLGNGPHLGGMGGDEVGVVTAWGYPKVDAPFITTSDIERVQAAINGGRWRADQRAKNEPWVGIAVAQVLGLDLRSKADKRAVAKLVDGWLRAGFLKQVVGQDSHFAAVPYIEVGAKPPSETPAEAPEPGVDGPWGAGNA